MEDLENTLELFSQTDSFDDSQELLPDLDDTEIIDGKVDKREVSLFTQVKGGKVVGAESTPFQLPQRWTYDTLKQVLQHYVNKNIAPHRKIKQLYYKRSRGKSVVFVNGDDDIPALLKEYPMCYPYGKKKTGQNCIMYLAVDLEDVHTPRRSPRIAKNHVDIFVHQYSDGKVTNAAEVIHNVDKNVTLEQIISMLLTQTSGQTIYTQQKGLYWLRKNSKNPVLLKTEKDLDSCKKEYDKSLRIACAIEGSASETVQNRKRKLDLSQAGENEIWNQLHVQLVRDLEKKGVLWRYGAKHLKLWTDMMLSGEVCGVGEEPQWEEHLDKIVTPPESRRSSSPSISSSESSGDRGQLPGMFEMFIMQNQQRMDAESRRAEMFQTTLLTLLSSNIVQRQNQSVADAQVHLHSKMSTVGSSPQSTVSGLVGLSPYEYESSASVQQQQTMEGKDLRQFTFEDCLSFLNVLGLGHLKDVFVANRMDGPLLYALTHPQLGDVMLESMKLNPSDQKILVRGIKDQLKM